ncbi:MAG: metal ABC transporter substrate-binding protein, partial [Thermoplasmatota archaeon]
MAGRTTWVLALVASTVVVGLAGCINTDAAHGEPKPEVVVTIYPLAFVTHWIAGDDLHVETLVPAGLPPAEWEPSPSDVIRASEARLLVTNGAGLDGWIAPVAQAVRASGGIVVEATAGLHLMDAGKYEEQEKRDTPAPGAAGEDGHDHGHDHGHSHGDPADAAAAPVAADQRPADPHTWLDPLRLAAMADNILAGLVALDPGRADDWNTRAGELRGALAGLHERYSEGLRHCDNRHLFTTRNAFGYLDHR